MADLGTDFSLINGFVRVAGIPNLVGAIQRRLSTPAGGLFYSPNYGFDLREYVQATFDAATQYELERLTQAEVEKDPRVQSASAQVVQADLGRVILNISGLTNAGPFEMVLAVTSLSLEVINANT